MKNCMRIGFWVLSVVLAAGCVSAKHKKIRDLYLDVKENSGYRTTAPQEWVGRSLWDCGAIQFGARYVPSTNWTDDYSLEFIQQLKHDVDLGRNWTYVPEHVVIPKCQIPPVLDGTLDDETWKNALTFNGSYRINTTEIADEKAFWKICYDEKYIYFAAFFRDDDIGIDSKAPYWKDAFELFIQPDKRLYNFVELNVAPDGSIYSTWASRNYRVRYDCIITPLEHFNGAAVMADGGFRVEGRIGFADLPGYLLGNPPQSGQTINFIMVRTNYANEKKIDSDTVVPFLYDGHNVNGYIPATLE